MAVCANCAERVYPGNPPFQSADLLYASGMCGRVGSGSHPN